MEEINFQNEYGIGAGFKKDGDRILLILWTPSKENAGISEGLPVAEIPIENFITTLRGFADSLEKEMKK